MAKRYGIVVLIFLIFLPIGVVWLFAQDQNQDQNQNNSSDGSVIHVVVSMVQLNVAVSDEKGNYITTLHPSDFTVTEDGIPQKMASFEEGNAAPETILNAAQDSGQTMPPDKTASNELQPNGVIRGGTQSGSLDAIASSASGSNVFILFDTSNYMFHGRGFVFAQDSIAEFVRSLDHPYQVAFYSYSRNFYRAASLTSDRSQVIRGVRQTTNGDDSALYNALLMTLKDAAQHTGRKVVVVFSNGPDNSSMVSPEDVDELAQSEGIPIYIISTREAQLNAASAAVFARMTASTGGEAYFAKSWKDQRDAFSSIREDLAHLYFMSYYPQPNPNRGWRAISVKLNNPKFKKYRIRTRSGYRPIPARINTENLPSEQ